MKISIVTPTFNSEATILINVNSILNQTYSNFEHILIDNESSDNTLNLAKKEYRLRNSTEKLRIIREKDKGIAEAFNKGIEASSGEIIAILNSDDQYYGESVLEKVTNCFKDKNVLFVHGKIYFEDPLYGSNIRNHLCVQSLKLCLLIIQQCFSERKFIRNSVCLIRVINLQWILKSFAA